MGRGGTKHKTQVGTRRGAHQARGAGLRSSAVGPLTRRPRPGPSRPAGWALKEPIGCTIRRVRRVRN